MKMNFVKKVVVHVSLLGTVLFSQNCSNGFKVEELESLASQEDSSAPSSSAQTLDHRTEVLATWFLFTGPTT